MPGGRIDLLACSVAKGADGLAFVKKLEEVSGVTVAASTDKTGAGAGVEGGFDFLLEMGRVDAASVYFTARGASSIRMWRHKAEISEREMFARCLCWLGCCCCTLACHAAGCEELADAWAVGLTHPVCCEPCPAGVF